MQDLLPPLIWFAELGWALLTFAALGRVFAVLGEPAWAAWVPLYNLVVLARLGRERPMPHVLLLLIPGLNLIAIGYVSVGLARRLGKGAIYGLGLAYLPHVFYPLMAFELRRPREGA